MTTEQLRSLIRAEPFTPFMLDLADGKSVTVPHPDMIAYGGGRNAFVVLPSDGFAIVNLLLVASIRSMGPAVAVAGNAANS